MRRKQTPIPDDLNPFINPALMIAAAEKKRLAKIDAELACLENTGALYVPPSAPLPPEHDPRRYPITVSEQDIEDYAAAVWLCEPGARYWLRYYNFYGVHGRVQTAKERGRWAAIVHKAQWVRENGAWRFPRVQGVYVVPKQFELIVAQ